MNILFLNDEPFNPLLGGIARVTDVLAKELLSKGYNIFYLTGGNIDRIKRDNSLPIPQYFFPTTGFFVSQANRAYYRNLVYEQKIDVVINQRGLENIFNTILEESLHPYVISVVHSMPMAYKQAALSMFLYHDNSTKSIIKVIIKLLLYPLYKSFIAYKHTSWAKKHYKYILEKSHKLILLSNKYKNDLLSLGLNSYENKIMSIPNPNSFKVSNLEMQSKENIVLYVGRLSSEKNIIELLKIWKDVERKHLDWKLLFVGEGDQLDNMRRYIKKKSITNVILLGHQENVIKYYKISRIICLTSFYEGWPMAIIEGMQFGCVPVLYNTFSAASDIIDHGNNGYIVSPFHRKSFERHLSYLMDNPVRLAEMSVSAFQKVAMFNSENVVNSWIQILEEL